MRIYARWIGALLLSMLALNAFADDGRGWQPIDETIRKSDHDPRSYQAITLSNGMTVLAGVRCCRAEIAGSADVTDRFSGRSRQSAGPGTLSGTHGADGGQKIIRSRITWRSFSRSTAAATMPAQPRTAPRFTWKLKTMRCNRRWIVWRMRLRNPCSTRPTRTASGMRLTLS